MKTPTIAEAELLLKSAFGGEFKIKEYIPSYPCEASSHLGGAIFTVIDNTTGLEADMEQIALNEDWAKNLIYCDMEGFGIEQDGTLILVDECGTFEYCPEGRFTIQWSKP